MFYIKSVLGNNPYNNLLKPLKIGSKEYKYYDISSFGKKYGAYQ